MIYQVPVEKVSKLKKLAAKLSKKGANIICNEVGEPHLIKKDGLEYLAQDMEVEGTYKIPGWDFLAYIEHSKGGNVVSKVTNEPLDQSWYTATPRCDHCHSNRDRKYTCLVKNTETGEIKQVGKSCLRDYTGMDMEIAADLATFINTEMDEYFTDFSDVKNSVGPYTFLYAAYPYVKRHGYTKDTTAKAIIQDIYSLPKASDEEIDELVNWLKRKNEDTFNEYFRNAWATLHLPAIERRHYNILASLVASYFRDKARMAQRQQEVANTEYVGKVGDKITFKVVTCTTISSFKSDYGYNNWVSILKLTDEEGHVYIWKTSGAGCLPGEILKATIKGHQEYRGEKQTVITRASVIGGSSDRLEVNGRTSRIPSSDDEFNQALNMFIEED